jgi:hypothetical protein
MFAQEPELWNQFPDQALWVTQHHTMLNAHWYENCYSYGVSSRPSPTDQ